MDAVLTTSVPLCENCQRRPAKLAWTLADGSESFACGECGRPASGVTLRELDSDQIAAAPSAGTPLSVEQAAKRENVSPRTIHRWLPELQGDNGAWKVGAHWRIDAAALDRRRVRGPKPRAHARAREKPTPRDVGGGRRAADGIVWPE
jgi:excisionase family DNA binding protein